MQAFLDSFADPTGWHWLALGAVLIAVEVFAAGTVVLWFGLAALVVGIVLLIVPSMALGWQFILFGVIAVAGVLLWFLAFRPEPERPAEEEERMLNQPLQRLVGRRGTVIESDASGRVRIRLGDTTYSVRSTMPVEAGMVVEVTAIEEGRLVVRPY